MEPPPLETPGLAPRQRRCQNTTSERYLALYHTPQEHGGCQGCRFFLMCKGNCPGTAIGGDWRNRSVLCGVWRRLYEHLEEDCLEQGVVPLSLAKRKRARVEQMLLDGWAAGQLVYLYQALGRLKGSGQGSVVSGQKNGCGCAVAAGQHGDRHGDSPHGDSHGDGARPARSGSHGDHTDHGDSRQRETT